MSPSNSGSLDFSNFVLKKKVAFNKAVELQEIQKQAQILSWRFVDAFVVWGLTNIPQPRWDRTLKKSVGCLEISQHIELSSGRTVESISLGAAVGGSILVNLVGGGTLDFGGIEYQSMIDTANAVGFDNGSFERELTALNDRLQANIKRYLTANPKED